MRGRRGLCYTKLTTNTNTNTLSLHRYHHHNNTQPHLKKPKTSPENTFFDALPDDLLISIFSNLISSATSPCHFFNLLITCKRFKGLCLNSIVLSNANPLLFSINPIHWSQSSHRFLKLCSDAGNVHASYTLGMIKFYCLENRGSGASLMAKAAIKSHAPALYSLALIQFNGSGGTKTDKNLRAGIALCARAAVLGHVDALRELGHCLQDGYGVRQNISEGRKFLVQANARELAASLMCTTITSPPSLFCCHVSPLLSDFGCNVPPPEPHPANRFLVGWFSGRDEVRPGPRVCSHSGCGRPETREHEFRRCSVCGAVNYCSRACQALDWKLRHKMECTPMERLVGNNAGFGEVNAGDS